MTASRRDLEAALALENKTERKLSIAGAVASAQRSNGWRRGLARDSRSRRGSFRRSRESCSAERYAEKVRRISLAEWRAYAPAGRELARRLGDAFPRPYRRERPRDAEEGRLLRERGTPEHLIGPERER
jgi:hypothetical protein